MDSLGYEVRPGGLPAERFRLASDEFVLPTPADERGIIDTTQLVDYVRLTLTADVVWPEEEPNMHHFYWPARFYRSSNEYRAELMTTFRNLPIHRGFMPVQFHNWLHRITEPPEIPSIEVMEYRVEAWNVASNLFNVVRGHKRRTRSLLDHYLRDVDRSYIGALSDAEQGVIDDLYNDFFNRFPELYRRLYSVPREFQLVDPRQSFDEMHKQLGKIAGTSALQYTRRASLAPAS